MDIFKWFVFKDMDLTFWQRAHITVLHTMLLIFFPSFYDRMATINVERHLYKTERDEFSHALAEAYQTLDRIALRDDSPSIELSMMANDFITKHKLTVQYH